MADSTRLAKIYRPTVMWMVYSRVTTSGRDERQSAHSYMADLYDSHFADADIVADGHQACRYLQADISCGWYTRG